MHITDQSEVPRDLPNRILEIHRKHFETLHNTEWSIKASRGTSRMHLRQYKRRAGRESDSTRVGKAGEPKRRAPETAAKGKHLQTTSCFISIQPDLGPSLLLVLLQHADASEMLSYRGLRCVERQSRHINHISIWHFKRHRVAVVRHAFSARRDPIYPVPATAAKCFHLGQSVTLFARSTVLKSLTVERTYRGG